MRGDHHLLAVTTTVDEISGETKPLFAFPVQVCKATESNGDVNFDVAAPSGAPRVQVYRDSATGELVENDDCPRGIRIGDEFRPIDPDAIEQIKEATKIKTMVCLGTVALPDLRARYGDRVTGSYYLQVPAKGGSAKAYRLTYEALREVTKPKAKAQPARALITKRTAKSRQKLAFIYADEDAECLRMCEVVFAAKVREPDAQVLAHQQAQVEDAAIEKARQVVAGLADGTAALDSEIDEAVVLREALIEQALAGEAVAAPQAVAETVEQDDLEAALEASLTA